MRPIMLVGHERPLTQVKYNREGDLVFSCSKDTVASVWFSINGERLGTLEGHQGSIWSIDVDQYTQLCATGSADYSVKVWNVNDGTTAHTWKSPVPVKRVDFSPCGRYVSAILDDVMKYVGSVNIYEIKRDPKTHQVLQFVEEPVARIETREGLAAAQVSGWSAEGKYILVGHKDGSVSKYDTTRNYEFCGSLPLHKGNVSDIQFSPDRSYFITSSRDANSYIVDVDQLQVLKKYEADCPLNSACITPLKDFVILGGGQAARDVTTTAAREGKFEARFYHKIFEEEIGRVRGHFGPLNCVAVNPQGTSYCSGAEDGFVRIHHFEKSYYDFKYEVERAAEAKEHMLAA